MTAFADLLRAIRIAHAELAVYACDAAVRRAKRHLADALAARDAAIAHQRIAEHQAQPRRTVPASLLRIEP